MPFFRNRFVLRRVAAGICGVCFVAELAGCSGSQAPVVEMYPPDKAGQLAVELYDANKDGKIAAAELDKCLALKYALPRVDKSGDKAVTADEIAGRMRELAGQSARMSTVVHITSRQGPVSGATVTLTPEPFMGADLSSYTVTTDEAGNGVPQLQGAEEGVSDLPLGFYRITISAPGQAGDVIRGCEVADDSPTSNRLAFSLQDEAPVGGGRGGR